MGTGEFGLNSPDNLSPLACPLLEGDPLPYANIGHSRWITGQSLIEYMTAHAETKTSGNAAESAEQREKGCFS